MSVPALFWTMVAAGAVTFFSRAVFLVGRPAALQGYLRRFLGAFPLALFVSLAVVQGIAAGWPGVIGLAAGGLAAAFQKNLLVIIGAGYAASLLARLAGLR